VREHHRVDALHGLRQRLEVGDVSHDRLDIGGKAARSPGCCAPGRADVVSDPDSLLGHVATDAAGTADHQNGARTVGPRVIGRPICGRRFAPC
jgi:hypothetical protein